MNIIVSDRNEDIIDEAERNGLTVHRGLIFDVKADAIVSPANSFGFMDGGFDHALTEHFGVHIQEMIQNYRDHRLAQRELLVGQALVLSTSDPDIPFLVSAPTMRAPNIINKTVNVYLAVKAVLITCSELESIKTIVFPGMGTGCGKVSPEQFVRQLKAAIEDFEKPRRFEDLLDATVYERWLIYG
jgi:O-acetyl-ADP-ribose deacetylase (regulator of RNase III)